MPFPTFAALPRITLRCFGGFEGGRSNDEKLKRSEGPATYSSHFYVASFDPTCRIGETRSAARDRDARGRRVRGIPELVALGDIRSFDIESS
jgi:hypothetical protein